MTRERVGERGRQFVVIALTLAFVSAYPYVRFLAGARSHRSAAVGFLTFDTGRLIAWSVAGVLVGFILIGLLDLVGSGLRRASAAVVVFLFMALSWQPFELLIERLEGSVPASVSWAPTAGVVAFAVVIVVEAWRLGDTTEFLPIAAVILAAMTVVATWQFFAGEGIGPIPSNLSTTIVSAGAEPRQHPDLYIIVLDGYGSARALQEYAGFDNSEFVGDLESRGLQVAADARSTYSYTVFSVASMFALERPIAEGPFEATARLAAQQNLMVGGPLLAAFRDAGYSVVHVENGWSILECDSRTTDCRRASTLNEYDWAFLQSTAIPDIFPAADIHPWARGSVRQLEILGDIAEEDSSSPRVVLAHILAPHPPFQLEEDCSLRSREDLQGFRWAAEDVDVSVRQAGFHGQISCINRLMAEFLDTVPDGAAIVITGDHGSDFLEQTQKPAEQWDERDIDERLSILLATRLPQSCNASEIPMNPIDAMRNVANCILGSDLPPLDLPPLVVEYNRDGSGRAVAVGR